MEQPRDLPKSKPVSYDIKTFSDNEGSKIFHGFYGRQGGVSVGVYDSLNCGFGSDDEYEYVSENRSIIADIIGVPAENLITAYQEHSAKCIKVSDVWTPANAPKADAMVTDVPGIALGILTADCAPILFHAEDDGRQIIGAAHAGWRGALAGVLESTVGRMVELGARKTEIKACIGPCIGKSSYEVGSDLYEQFMEESNENERFFGSAQKDGHFIFDLAGYCAFKLYNLGLARVYIKDLDTYFNEGDFFSCRRALHRNEHDYGRQLSVVVIKP